MSEGTSDSPRDQDAAWSDEIATVCADSSSGPPAARSRRPQQDHSSVLQAVAAGGGAVPDQLGVAQPPRAAKRRLSQSARETLASITLAESAPAETARRRGAKTARDAKAARDRADLAKESAQLALAIRRETKQVPAELFAIARYPTQSRSQQWPMSIVISQLQQRAQTLNIAQHADSPVAKIAQHFFDRGSGIVLTKEAFSNLIGVDARKIGPSIITLAEVLLYADRLARSMLETRLALLVSSERLVDMIDFDRQDETPMAVTRHAWHPAQNSGQQNAMIVAARSHQFLAHMEKSLKCISRARKTMSKILQSESVYAYRFIGNGGPHDITIIGACVNPLQILDRTTGECLRAAWRHRTSLKQRGHVKFKARTRSTCADAAGGNDRSERAVLSDLGCDWRRLHFKCDIHAAVNNCHDSMFVCDDFMKAQRRWASSINFGTGLTMYGETLEELVFERIDVRYGQPPDEHKAYRNYVTCLCMRNVPNQVEMLIASRTLPNGNWRNHEKVEVYVPLGTNADPHAIASAVAWSFKRIFAGTLFTKYVKSKWKGVSKALSQFVLPFACCGLGAPAYERFAERARAINDKCIGRPVQGAAAGGGGAPVLAIEGGGGPADGGGGVCGGGAQDGAHGGVGEQASKVDQERSHREENNKDIEIGLELSQSDPTSRTLITIQVALAHEMYLDQLLDQGSVDWEAAQRASQARALLAPSGQGQPRANRSFELLEMAKGGADSNFLTDIVTMMNSATHWDVLVGDADKTLECRAFTFKLLSGSLCTAGRTACLRHKVEPVATFRCLLSDADADDFANKPQCLHDPWSKRFLDEFVDKPGGLRSDDAQAALRFQCRLARRHMAKIECWHAALRRRLYMRGVHANGQAFAEVNAEAICDRVHARVAYNTVAKELSKLTANGLCDGSVGPDGDCDDLRDRWYSGPWHAYVRYHTFGTEGRPDLSALSAAYNALTPDEKQFYIDLAKGAQQQLAKLRPGEGAFGFTSRALRRQQRSAQAAAAAERTQADEASGAGPDPMSRRRAAFSAVSLVMRRSDNRHLHELVASAKAEQRRMLLEAGRRRAADQRALREWAATKGKALLEETVAQNPVLQPFKQCLYPVPDVDDVVFELIPTTTNALKVDFDSMSTPILHELSEPIVLDEKKKKIGPPPCHEVGICLCSGDGVLIWKMRNAYLAKLKVLYKAGPMKSLLRQQSLVVRFDGHREQLFTEMSDGWGDEFADLLGGGEVGPAHLEMWFHIGAHSLNPYRSSFLALVVGEDPDRVAVVDGEIMLE
ncbi:unnamed protein product, partial [Prorocentrum cordatum]